jgi:hypothetical protein
MENATRTVSLDADQVHLQSDSDVDNAIDTVVTFAFGNAEPLDRYLFRIRAALPHRPSVKELVEAVFRVRGELGPISDEGTRRQNAAMAMAAFLSADPSELGLPAAMFRLGPEVWLTPSRTPPS